MNNNFKEMKKPMQKMLIGLAILFGGIFIYKMIMSMIMQHYLAQNRNPTVTVSTMIVQYDNWQPQLKSVGSLRAMVGVSVTAQLAGMISTIYLTPGSIVQSGIVLVQQNAISETAQLHSLQANADLAKITYDRDLAQFKFQAVSKQQVDSDRENLRSLLAQVVQQEAIVNKLTIRAPFAGRLGISKVNPGQFLNPGDQVVTLQRLDPIYVDFYLPQQNLTQIEIGQEVTFTTDTFPGRVFSGKLSTIDPIVDVNTRNVQVEATVSNPDLALIPGMFVNAQLNTGEIQKYLTLPQSAISFNPYGNIVFIVNKDKNEKDSNGKPILTVMQKFVTTGDTRGDQITILKGLKEGDVIVTSGQLKLKNGTRIAINNSVQPLNNPNPDLSNNHEDY